MVRVGAKSISFQLFINCCKNGYIFVHFDLCCPIHDFRLGIVCPELHARMAVVKVNTGNRYASTLSKDSALVDLRLVRKPETC